MSWLTSSAGSGHLGFLAFLLAALYIIRWWVAPELPEVRVGRNHFLLRALNWVVFGVIFVLRGIGVLDGSSGIARLAILFLMLPEIAYQIVLTLPEFRKKVIVGKNGEN